ncbi:MAG: hypothetical protein HP494_13765 [Nitrospira sp.]|nr:hypothetical protein [Nitrospira sp.]
MRSISKSLVDIVIDTSRLAESGGLSQDTTLHLISVSLPKTTMFEKRLGCGSAIQLLQGRLFMAIIQFVLAGILWLFLLGWIIHLWSILDAALWKPKHSTGS